MVGDDDNHGVRPSAPVPTNFAMGRVIGRDARRVLLVRPSRTRADQVPDTLHHTADQCHSPMRYAICEVDESLSCHGAPLPVAGDGAAGPESATVPETMGR